LSARTILLAAAEKAELQPAASGRYWHTDVRRQGYSWQEKASHRYRVVDADRDEQWNPRGAGKNWQLSQDLGGWPETAKDKVEWQAAGSPSAKAWIPVPKGPPLSADRGTPRPPGRAVLETQTLQKPEEYYAGKWITLTQLQALPADAGKLRALLSRNSGEKQVTDERLFDLSTNLFLYSPITPQVRAAIFRCSRT
jgi:hypothetical protein